MLCVCCMCSCVCKYTWSPEKSIKCPGTGVTVSAHRPRWVLGAEPRSSTRAVSALNCRVTSPAHQALVFFFFLIFMCMILFSRLDSLCVRYHYILIFRPGKRGMGGRLLKVTHTRGELPLRQKHTPRRAHPQVLSDPQHLLREHVPWCENYNLLS